MTGIVGGLATGRDLDAMVAATHNEDWYETERLEAGPFGLALSHHADRDPGGHATWQEGNRIGVVFGALPNVGDIATTFADVLSDPISVLPSLDGPFLLAVADGSDHRVVVATDSLGTRPCYYARDGTFAFSSDVAPLLTMVDDPQIDVRGISDMLMIGHVWGEKTLVNEIRYLPSGSVLEYDGDVSTRRYWHHDFASRYDDTYVGDLVAAYREAIADTTGTIQSEVGLWLSGGLDSRTMAAELSRHGPLKTYTYDANPGGGANLKPAREVATLLGLPNIEVELTPERFLDVLETCVSLTNGMTSLKSFVNLSSVFNIPHASRANVILEACGQGGMLGDGIKGTTIKRAPSAEEALYHAKHVTDVDDVRRLLRSEYEPMSTYREEVVKSEQLDLYSTVMDCYYRNYFSRGDFASNAVARALVGTRVPFAHRGFLDVITDMPVEYRARMFPFTEIPQGTSHMKLEFVRQLNGGLEKIPYERTKLPPTRPHWQHAIGFVVGTAVNRLLKDSSYGGTSMVGEWYHAHDPFAQYIDDALDAAMARPYLNGDEVRRYQREHREREADHMGTISNIVTTEIWIQNTFEA